jgi:hypothetical protein
MFVTSSFQDRLCSHSCWLQIQRSGFDSQSYHIFREVVGLERGPLSLVSTIEELHERKRIGSGLENREYGHREPSRWPRGTLYPQKLALTSPTSGGRSVGIVRSRTEVTEIFFFLPKLVNFCNILLLSTHASQAPITPLHAPFPLLFISTEAETGKHCIACSQHGIKCALPAQADPSPCFEEVVFIYRYAELRDA